MADGCTDVLLGCCDEPPPPPPLPAGYFYIFANKVNYGITQPNKQILSRKRYHFFSQRIDYTNCPGHGTTDTGIGTITIDKDTGAVVRTGNTVTPMSKAAPADTVEYSETVTATSLSVHAIYYCSSFRVPSQVLEVHEEYSDPLDDADMIGKVNALLFECNFSDFVANSPSQSGIFKKTTACGNGAYVQPHAGCAMGRFVFGCDIVTTNAAVWSISRAGFGNLVEYSANRLLINHGNNPTCIQFSNDIGQATYQRFDCADYCEITVGPPDVSRLGNIFNAAQAYSNPFAIFPPNQPPPCP